MLLNILHNTNKEKFHLQILNVCDKKYKEPENKREMYLHYRWIVCGCLFVTGPEIGAKILNRLNQVFIETTLAGYGHAEEMFYLEVLDEFYDDIERGYGDYNMILNNFLKPTVGFHYILYIIDMYFRIGYYRECFDCCEKLLNEIESHNVEIDYTIYFDTLIQYFKATLNYKGAEIAKQKIFQIRARFFSLPELRQIYMNNYENIEAEFAKCG
jgi:tetratricopeptide (TPR) repeat protein